MAAVDAPGAVVAPVPGQLASKGGAGTPITWLATQMDSVQRVLLDMLRRIADLEAAVKQIRGDAPSGLSAQKLDMFTLAEELREIRSLVSELSTPPPLMQIGAAPTSPRPSPAADVVAAAAGGVAGSVAAALAAQQVQASAQEEPLQPRDAASALSSEGSSGEEPRGGGSERAALLQAIRRGDVTEALRLLEVSDLATISASDSRGRTALHHAARRGLVAICRPLLEHRGFAKVSAQDQRLRTALHHAAGRGCSHACRMLLDCPKFTSAAATDADGATALHSAAAGGHAEACMVLLKHPRGVALDAADCLDRTALHHAARGGHLSACEALLADPGADASLWAEDFEGLTALHYAAIGGHAQVCRLVVEHPSFQRAFAEGAVDCEWLEQAHGAAHDVIQTALDQARRAMEAEEAAQIHGERRWAFEVNRPLDRTEEQANRLDLVMELFRLLGSGARRLGAEEQLHLAQLLGIHTTAVQWHGLAEHAAGHWWDEHGWEESPGPSFSQFERFIDDEDSPGHCRDDELQRILDRLHAEAAVSTTLLRPALPRETRLSKQGGAADGDAVEAERSGSEPLAPRTPERVDDPALSMGPSAAEGAVPARSRTAAPPTPEARAGSSAPKAKAKAKPRSQRAAPGQAGPPDASAPQPAAVAPELQQPAGRAGAPPPGLAPAPGAAAAAAASAEPSGARQLPPRSLSRASSGMLATEAAAAQASLQGEPGRGAPALPGGLEEPVSFASRVSSLIMVTEAETQGGGSAQLPPHARGEAPRARGHAKLVAEDADEAARAAAATASPDRAASSSRTSFADRVRKSVGQQSASSPDRPYPSAWGEGGIVRDDTEQVVLQLNKVLRSNTRTLYGNRITDPTSFFGALDRDGGGVLDREELAKGLRRLDVPCPDRDINKLLDRLDVDSSGSIVLEEFVQALQSARAPRASQAAPGTGLPSPGEERPAEPDAAAEGRPAAAAPGRPPRAAGRPSLASARGARPDQGRARYSEIHAERSASPARPARPSRASGQPLDSPATSPRSPAGSPRSPGGSPRASGLARGSAWGRGLSSSAKKR